MTLLTLIFFTEKNLFLKGMAAPAPDVIPACSSGSVLLSSPRFGDDRALPSRKLLLIVIDFDDFMCMTCLDSFIRFCRAFPQAYLDGCAWGILILKEETEGSGTGRNAVIAEKKMRGFAKANHLTFPFLIDETGSFNSFVSKGSSVFLFDEESRRISRYGFPLDGKDMLQVQRSLFGN